MHLNVPRHPDISHPLLQVAPHKELRTYPLAATEASAHQERRSIAASSRPIETVRISCDKNFRRLCKLVFLQLSVPFNM